MLRLVRESYPNQGSWVTFRIFPYCSLFIILNTRVRVKTFLKKSLIIFKKLKNGSILEKIKEKTRTNFALVLIY